MNPTKIPEEVIMLEDPEGKKVIAYIRVSTDDQDILKQREIIEHYCKRLKLSVTKFVRVEASSRKSMIQRELTFLNT